MAGRYTEGTKLPESRIWVVDTAGGEARQWTSGPRSDSSPRWSPDSSTLAFLSDREENGQPTIHTISRGGGEARPLCELEGSVSALEWSPDGAHIAFLMTDPRTEEEKRREKEKDDAIEWEINPKYQRLWVANADGTGLRPVSTGNVQVWELAWFPDSASLAVVCSALPHEWSWYEAYLGTVPISGSEVSRIYGREGEQVALPRPSPDGAEVAFVSGVWSDRGVVGGDILSVPAGGGEARNLTQGYPASFSWIEWRDSGVMDAIGYEDGDAAVYSLEPGRKPEKRWAGEAAFLPRFQATFSHTADGGTLALVRGDHVTPQEVWTLHAEGDPAWQKLTSQQPQLDGLWSGEPETLRWKSPDGTAVQGVLLKPLGYQEGERYPLVTIVHGGPTSLYAHSYIADYFMAPLLISNGYAVLLPNPRGSTGWGREFAEANLGDMGGGDLADILAGVDAVIEQGIADPERLGIAGWSYGGYMTAWTVTQTDRFKAAIMGAGIANWRSFHGTSNLPTWDSRYLEGEPYKLGGQYDSYSPALQAHKVTTPTLILHGQEDAYVPVGQAHEYYRALREQGVDVRLVIYPREGHGILEKAHARDLMQRFVAWFGEKL